MKVSVGTVVGQGELGLEEGIVGNQIVSEDSAADVGECDAYGGRKKLVIRSRSRRRVVTPKALEVEKRPRRALR